MRNWTKEMELVLLSKTANYSNQEKKYTLRLFQESNLQNWNWKVIETDLQTIEDVINEIPNKTNEKNRLQI
jgi:hypothetical protein